MGGVDLTGIYRRCSFKRKKNFPKKIIGLHYVRVSSYLVDMTWSRSSSGGSSPGRPCGDTNVRLLNLRWGLEENKDTDLKHTEGSLGMG